MHSNDRIRHEPEERCSILTSFVVGIQGIMLALPPAISVVVVTALAANQDEEYLTWAMFAALMIMAIVTALQASRIGRLGSGHMVVTGVTPNYIALAVLALAEGGPGDAGEPDAYLDDEEESLDDREVSFRLLRHPRFFGAPP